MTEWPAPERNRPATNPGGMQCWRCDEIFIGEEWHDLCAVCAKEFEALKAEARAVSAGDHTK